MILTDREIQISLEEGLIEISPPPEADAFSSTSVDLRLGDIFSEFIQRPMGPPGLVQGPPKIDPGAPGYSFTSVLGQITKKVPVDAAKGYELEPNRLVLAWTRERVNLKSHARVAARVEGKSSLARLGLAIHITAPTIHAGFGGEIQLEMVNYGPLPIILRPGLRVCQLVFELTLGVPVRGYGGQFSKQSAQR